MKIKSINVLNDGMGEVPASLLWEKIAGFAGYAFNRSHACAYSIISYQCMWLKVHYPVEFFAAAMTVIDDSEKLSGLVLDARRMGIDVLPPDINVSTDRIEILSNKALCAPFQAIKGISSNIAGHILAVRSHHGKPFESKADFEGAVASAKLGSKVNVRARTNLDLVGAFSSVEPSQLPALHTDRLRDRLELMPGFTVDAVKATRGIGVTAVVTAKLTRLASEVIECAKCSLSGCKHAIPQMGKAPKFMMVFDTPNGADAASGKMLGGTKNSNAEVVWRGLADVGLTPNDGYYTALVRSPKPAGAKVLTNEMINGCSGWLEKEIEALKPPVIVAMGSNAIRFFAPGVKGSPAELAGKVIYRADLDASIIFGLNPAMLYHDSSKLSCIQDAFAKLSELVQ